MNEAITTELVHFDTARRELALATNIDEVKQIRNQAEALRQYIRQQGASLEMQNQCAEIKLRAERRAGEMLANTERNKGAAALSHDTTALPPTLAELGISKDKSSDWQLEASIPDEDFERHIAEVKASGDELTSVGLQRLAKELKGKPHISYNTGEYEWYTPQEYIALAKMVMGDIDLDPASSEQANEVVKAEKYYSTEDGGLDKEWNGRVWLNPPYSQPHIRKFCDKLIDEYKTKRINEAMILVNNATETTWFQDIAKIASAICFPLGRVKFWSPTNGNSAPLQGQALLYIGGNSEKFIALAEPFGLVLTLVKFTEQF